MRIRWIYRSHSSAKRDGKQPATGTWNVVEEGAGQEQENWRSIGQKAIIELIFCSALLALCAFCSGHAGTEIPVFKTRCTDLYIKNSRFDFYFPIILTEPDLEGWTISGDMDVTMFNRDKEIRSQGVIIPEVKAMHFMSVPWIVGLGVTHYTIAADWKLTRPDNTTKFLKQKYLVSCDIMGRGFR